LGLAFRIFAAWLTWPDHEFSYSRKVEEFQLVYFYISFSNEVHSKLAVLSFRVPGSSDLVGQWQTVPGRFRGTPEV
jgi:hypothetical protein